MLGCTQGEQKWLLDGDEAPRHQGFLAVPRHSGREGDAVPQPVCQNKPLGHVAVRSKETHVASIYLSHAIGIERLCQVLGFALMHEWRQGTKEGASLLNRHH